MDDFDEIMLDIGWKNLDAENKRHSELDTKAIGLITITGILITFLIGSVDPTLGLSGSKILFLLTLFFFLITVYKSIKVLEVKKMKALSSESLFKKLINEDSDFQIKTILRSIVETETAMRNKNTEKADKLRVAVNFLGYSVVFLIFYVTSLFFNPIEGFKQF